ncbi:hypothetical protein HUJ04_011601 [Dendroctonus ponderosae]|nr:hypothetical protein HUJ04_011601 [Dendroctonus ponderosae]
MKIVILFISFALFVTRIEAKKKNSTTTTASGQLASFHETSTLPEAKKKKVSRTTKPRIWHSAYETSTLPGAKKKKPTKSTKSKHLHIIIIASRIPVFIMQTDGRKTRHRTTTERNPLPVITTTNGNRELLVGINPMSCRIVNQLRDSSGRCREIAK